MSKITLDNLSDNLKDLLNNAGISEEQVQELIDLMVEENIGNVNNLMTENKTIVGSINEVKDAIDNKDLSEYQTIVDNDLLTTNKTIVEAINEVFQSGNSVKQELVATLVAKGLSATTDMSFDELINYFNELIDMQGTAVVSDVLTGKTFINSSGKGTGNIANNTNKTITPKSTSQTLSNVYCNNTTVKGDSNLKAENIVSGKTIFGVRGSL